MLKVIERVRGDTYPIRVAITKNKRPYDIAGCSFVLSGCVEENPQSQRYLFQITGVVQTPTSAGIVLFTPTEEQMNRVGRVYFDVSMTDAGGFKRTPVKAIFEFTQDITK